MEAGGTLSVNGVTAVAALVQHASGAPPFALRLACDGKVEVTEAEVDQEIVKVAKKFNMSVEQWYNMLQEERHVSKARIFRRNPGSFASPTSRRASLAKS